jgi:hypothetical protein
MADANGLPCTMAAQSVLETAVLASQVCAFAHLDGRVHSLSLYLLTVVCPDDRKSAEEQAALQVSRD